jgi:hypothetical protein
MATFGITPVTGYPIPPSDDFPQFIQFQQDGTNLGGPDADTVNITGGLTARRGTGENANVITIEGDGSAFSWNEQTAAYTLDLSDAGNGIAMNVATQTPLTIPAYADQPFSPGDAILVYQQNAGQVEIVGDTGVTVVARGSPSPILTSGEFAVLTLINRDTNLWIVADDYNASGGPINWRSFDDDTTLIASDAENGLAANALSSAVVRIPAFSSVPFATGVSILLLWDSGVQPTVIGDSGVIVNVDADFDPAVAREQGIISIINRDTDVWVLAGDLAGGNAGGGTVTAVGLDMPAEFAVDPYEITTAGTFTVTKAPQGANRVWAGPVSGAAATPAFRPLVRADVEDAQRLVWRTVSGNYTLVLSDAENGIAMNGSVLTIPSHSEVPFDDGTSILLLDEGYGNPISIIGQSGVQVKVRSALQPVTAGESAIVTIIQRGIDVWYLAGDLEIS